MNFFSKRIVAFVIMLLLSSQIAFAAGVQSNITGIRFSQKAEAVRIVFDADAVPEYKVSTTNNGVNIVIDMLHTVNNSSLENLAIDDNLVQSVTFTTINKDTLRTMITLNRNASYKVNKLANPNRFYIDIIKNFDRKIVDEVAPGIKHITLVRSNAKGMLTANFLDIDGKANVQLHPVLANDVIAGRQVLSSMALHNNALAAINASYFAPSGEILGLTKIDNTIVSTSYLARGAFGIQINGKPMIGQVNYSGVVTLANGMSIPISGVNCERGEDALVVYNPYFDSSTRSNAYGIEYVVKNGTVIAINQNDSPLEAGTIVVSAHGSSKDKLANVKVGDKIKVNEDLGAMWNQVPQIMGVGPLLLKNNNVYVTSKEEEFGTDVASGRAPRTAVGITKDSHFLLAVVDGRQENSIGCTLSELAVLMQEMGAVDAVNFDGGGSSEMVIKNEVVNRPSDGSERKVGAALVVLSK
ncbi:MAG: exopolysaccharide biosynthesis protein [Firmicutes bacterium]|nr:exopolysaccharide biosynthesis protein [Bacillota bacterium]